MKRVKITVHKPVEMKTLESGLSVKEVAKEKLKIIEHSDAWKKHQKEHDDAKLQLMGAQDDSEKLGDMEKAIFEAAEEVEPKKDILEEDTEESKAPGQEVETKIRGSYAGGSQVEGAGGYAGDSESQGEHRHYAGGTGGMVMATCNCGETFKADESGDVSPYKIGTEASETQGAYKKSGEKQEEFGRTYSKKSTHEEVEESRKYR